MNGDINRTIYVYNCKEEIPEFLCKFTLDKLNDISDLDTFYKFAGGLESYIYFFDEDDDLVRITAKDFHSFKSVLKKNIFKDDKIIILTSPSKISQKFKSRQEFNKVALSSINLLNNHQQNQQFTESQSLRNFEEDLTFSNISSSTTDSDDGKVVKNRYDALYKGDINYLYGSEILDGQTISKKWKLKNIGTKKWKSNSLKAVLLHSEFNDWISFDQISHETIYADQCSELTMKITINAKWDEAKSNNVNSQRIHLYWLIYMDKLLDKELNHSIKTKTKKHRKEFKQFILTVFQLNIVVNKQAFTMASNTKSTSTNAYLTRANSDSSIEKFGGDYSFVDACGVEEIELDKDICQNLHQHEFDDKDESDHNHRSVQRTNADLTVDHTTISSDEDDDCPRGSFLCHPYPQSSIKDHVVEPVASLEMTLPDCPDNDGGFLISDFKDPHKSINSKSSGNDCDRDDYIDELIERKKQMNSLTNDNSIGLMDLNEDRMLKRQSDNSPCVISQTNITEDLKKKPNEDYDQIVKNSDVNQTKINSNYDQTKFDSNEKQTKMTSNEGQTKFDSNEGQTKFDSNEGQIKMTSNEGLTKVTSNEGQTKIDSNESQTKIDSNEGQTKINSNEGQTKIDSNEGQTKSNPNKGQGNPRSGDHDNRSREPYGHFQYQSPNMDNGWINNVAKQAEEAIKHTLQYAGFPVGNTSAGAPLPPPPPPPMVPQYMAGVCVPPNIFYSNYSAGRVPTPKEVKTEENVNLLKQMGFKDENRLRRLLHKFDNNIEDVVNDLVD